MSGPARIVLNSGSGGEGPRAFDGAVVIIGRSEGCDLVVEGSTVSRRHVEVALRPDGLWIADLESSHGTWLEGARIGAPTRVPQGARIRLGERGPEIIVHLGPGELPQARTGRRGALTLGFLVGAVSALVLLAFHDGTRALLHHVRDTVLQSR